MATSPTNRTAKLKNYGSQERASAVMSRIAIVGVADILSAAEEALNKEHTALVIADNLHTDKTFSDWCLKRKLLIN